MRMTEVIYVGGPMSGQRRFAYELKDREVIWDQVEKRWAVYRLHWPVSPKCRGYGGVPCYVFSGYSDDYK